MNNELVINVTASDVTIALLEDKRLVELSKEKRNPTFSGNVGDIYLGKVKKIMPGLNAAFVDVGYEKDAFLHYLDLGPQFQSLNKYLNQALEGKVEFTAKLDELELVPDIEKAGKISDVIAPGQKIVVQIAKEPISTKGPRLTSEVSIAGRNLVLIPFSQKVSVSTKVKSAEERARLKRLITSIKPENYGVIIRTVAEGKKAALLDAELRELIEKWEKPFQNMRMMAAPKRIIGELNRTSAILRDLLNNTFHNIFVNDELLHKEILEYIGSIAPDKTDIAQHYEGPRPIFEHFGITKQIKSLFGKTVTIKNGAYLVIEHTEALHVIDINSGNRIRKANDQETNALEVNMQCAEEVARQLRLRDMGGIIVVDFIDMASADNKQKLYDKMKEAMALDRTKHNILPLSKFGIMQITRQRVRPEMNIDTTEQCPVCRGTGESSPPILVVDEINNNLQYIVQKLKHQKLTLKAHPFVAAYINQGAYSIKVKWWVNFKVRLKVVSDPSYSLFEFYFFDKNDERIEL